MKKLMNTLPLLFSLALIAGCNTSKSTNNNMKPDNLVGTNWKLIEVETQSVPESSTAEFSVTKNNTFSGNTGCNQLNGDVELLKTGMIKFSKIATTRMACPGDISQVETKFLAAINSSDAFSIENNILSLRSGSKTVAKLKAKEKATGLEGNWELNYISGPRITFDGLYPDKKPTIVFNMADSSASGNSSCNSYSVPVELKGTKISFGEGLSTLMACEGDGETIYFKTLRSVSTYKLSGDNNTLELIKNGVAVMRFTRK